jgi:hypothetical protein
MSYDKMTPGGRTKATGPRREPEVESVVGAACHTCGQPIYRVYTLADVGAFCSSECRSAAADPTWRQRTA